MEDGAVAAEGYGEIDGVLWLCAVHNTTMNMGSRPASKIACRFTEEWLEAWRLQLDSYVMGFGGMEDVRFREPVFPGDRLVIAVERIRVRPKAMIVCRFQGIVRESIVVDGIIKGVPLPANSISSTAGNGSAVGG